MTIRLVFLLLSGRLEPYADESNYLYLALLWDRFGFYSDAGNYLWPPAYTYLLSRALADFGSNGILMLKLLQVAASGVVGVSTVLLARQMFDRRAAVWAGTIWCVYLPLVGFTHYIWPETIFLALFLPSLILVLRWCPQDHLGSASMSRLVAAGLLLGLAALVKEIGIYVLPIVCVAVFLKARRETPRSHWGYALLPFLSFWVIVMPWTLRNYEVYQRLVPTGATLGKNVFMGVNSTYRNIDIPQRARGRVRRANRQVIAALTGDAPEGWKPSDAPNVVDRSSDNVARGVEFALANPGFVVRTRIKGVADWLSPMSFYLRHYVLERYGGPLESRLFRRVFLTLALTLPIAVLFGSLAGLFIGVDERAIRWFLVVLLAVFFLSGALINASTRYRIAIDPLLIVLAAGFFSRPDMLRTAPTGSQVAVIVSWSILVSMWAVNLRELVTIVGIIW